MPGASSSRTRCGGLIAFRGRRDEGEVVSLFYELGEPDTPSWHRLDDGYAGRQAL